MNASSVLAAVPNLTGNADKVAWICFWAGVAVLALGILYGGALSWKEVVGGGAKSTKAKVQAARKALETAAPTTAQAPVAAEAAPNADEKAKAAAKAQDLMEDVEGLISALPERLRFAGLLVMVGVILMSVATVQFGGHAIF